MIRSAAFHSYVDHLAGEKQRLKCRGWVFHPEMPLDRVSVALAGQMVARDVDLLSRPDVADAYPDYPTSLSSGFEFVVPFDGVIGDPHNVLVELIPQSGGQTLRTIQAMYIDFAHDLTSRPQPPFHLMERIGGAANYVPVGSQTLSLILTNLASAGPIDAAERVLDWGCGPGRIAGHLAKFIEPSRIYGCDIDPEAIEWARENIRGPHFFAVAPFPPTDFPDAFFDRIYGISVMTHLDESAQLRWLEELQRISKPGACVLLSVMGAHLRSTTMPGTLVSEYSKAGFATYVPAYERDHGFQEFSPKGYYKESFHSPEYIERVWSQFFDVDECVLTGYQDLVVLRRR